MSFSAIFSLVCAVFLIFLTSCEKKVDHIDVHEVVVSPKVGAAKEEKLKVKALTLDFEKDIKELVEKSSSKIIEMTGKDEEYYGPQANGLLFEIDANKRNSVITSLKKLIGGRDYFAFTYDNNFGIKPDLVCVIRTKDKFDLLRITGTNGDNYDISNDKVIERIKLWDKKYGLKFDGVGFDWFSGIFVKPPKDMNKFAEEVYEFCPDVVDQGTESVEKLAEEMKKSNSVYLWWD